MAMISGRPSSIALEIVEVTVLRINKDSPRFYRFFTQTEGHNNHAVTNAHPMSSRSVHHDHPFACLTFHRVGLKAFAVLYTPYMHQLSGQQSHTIHQLPIYRDTPFIVHIGIGYPSMVYLAF